MADMQNLKTHAAGALGWIDKHWGLKQLLVSFVMFIPLSLMLTGVRLGVQEAYVVESAAEIMPAEQWAELATAGDDAASPLEGAIVVGAGAATLACVEFVGRITFAYLLWVPEPVLSGVARIAFYLPPVVMLLNPIWAVQRIYYRRNQPTQTRGETHG